MARRKHIIIGCGPAALNALVKIRELTAEDEVKLVTAEDCLPYSAASLPYLLSRKIEETAIWMRSEDFFKQMGSTLERGKEVIKVIPEKKKVVYRGGDSEKYDILLIASGSEPVKPPFKNVDIIRTLADCRQLLRRLGEKATVAISGAGMVGMEIAAALLERGHQVSIIEKGPGILPQHFHDEAETYIRDIFSVHKARFFTATKVRSARKQDGKIRIALSDGTSLDADILINATGVKSRVSFLEGSGIKVGNGILVDNCMRTNIEDVYAAGDAAEAPDFFTDKHRVNAIIYSAVTQGKVAGANMAGGRAKYEGSIPMMAFNFFGNQAFSIGLTRPWSSSGQVLKQKDDNKRSFSELVFEKDRLVGGMFLNETIDPGIIQYLIKRRLDMAPYQDALFRRTRPLSNPWLSALKFTTAIC